MLIGLAGYAQSGKDTVGKVFTERADCTRLAFADYLKDDLAELEGIPREWLDDPVRKEQYREKMKILGRERREEDPFHWIDRLRPRWQEDGNYVITDCRYLNELEEVIDCDGVWFYIIKYRVVDGAEYDTLPANEEEERSFREITEAVWAGDLPSPGVWALSPDPRPDGAWRAADGDPDHLIDQATLWIDRHIDLLAYGRQGVASSPQGKTERKVDK